MASAAQSDPQVNSSQLSRKRMKIGGYNSVTIIGLNVPKE
jgi:hypothetical protein